MSERGIKREREKQLRESEVECMRESEVAWVEKVIIGKTPDNV